ncbi:uncharacterized protein LOC142163045 [Nicotiana tabacum]|uniref:Uncharacterized protein LOC142163045 n=1 Tax=Nicotiana tabacum TaxID=4097 RepID=A0AC58RUJ2_TOBAC
MGDHNTRMQELRKEVDNLKGSMDTVVSSISDLRQMMDAKVAQAMEEIKNIILGNLTMGGDAQSTREEVVADRVPAVVQNRNDEYQLPTRSYQVEFPKFNGEGLKDWLYQCEQFFDVDGTPESSKVKLASCKVESRALQWHQYFMKHHVTREWPRWRKYVRCLYAIFGSELFDDPMGDLKDLRQVSSVQDYVDLFDELLTRVKLSEDYVVSCFIRGLKPEIGLPIKMLSPRTLAKAISLARI